MYKYIRFFDKISKKEKFAIVTQDQIKHYKPEKKNKKYKILVENEKVEGLVVFEADSEKALKEIIEKKRIKIPPASLISSASEETDVGPEKASGITGDNNEGIISDCDSDIEDILQQKLAAKSLEQEITKRTMAEKPTTESTIPEEEHSQNIETPQVNFMETGNISSETADATENVDDELIQDDDHQKPSTSGNHTQEKSVDGSILESSFEQEEKKKKDNIKKKDTEKRKEKKKGKKKSVDKNAAKNHEDNQSLIHNEDTVVSVGSFDADMGEWSSDGIDDSSFDRSTMNSNKQDNDQQKPPTPGSYTEEKPVDDSMTESSSKQEEGKKERKIKNKDKKKSKEKKKKGKKSEEMKIAEKKSKEKKIKEKKKDKKKSIDKNIVDNHENNQSLIHNEDTVGSIDSFDADMVAGGSHKKINSSFDQSMMNINEQNKRTVHSKKNGQIKIVEDLSPGPFSFLAKPGPPKDIPKNWSLETITVEKTASKNDDSWQPTHESKKGKKTPGLKCKSSSNKSEAKSSSKKSKPDKKIKYQEVDTTNLSNRLIELNAAYQSQTLEINKLNSALENQRKEIERMAASMAQMLDILRRHDSAAEQGRSLPLLQDQSGFPAVGFVEQSTNTIHIGEGVRVDLNAYNAAEFKAKTAAGFIKNMLMLLFSVDELLNSSPTGAQSNYRKVDQRKPPLDPTKVKALEDLYTYVLMQRHGVSEQDARSQAKTDVRKFIGSKLSDLRRAKRRATTRPNCNVPTKKQKLHDPSHKSSSTSNSSSSNSSSSSDSSSTSSSSDDDDD